MWVYNPFLFRPNREVGSLSVYDLGTKEILRGFLGIFIFFGMYRLGFVYSFLFWRDLGLRLPGI